MIFEIDQKTKQLRFFHSDWSPTELEIENYLITLAEENVRKLSIEVFGEELLLISNQIKTRLKKRADILALDKNGNAVIIELKRDKGRLGVETQALQYLSDFSKYRGADFIQHFGKNSEGDLEENVRAFLGAEFDLEDINRVSRIILIARSFDETLFSMGEWLSEKGVAYKCISYTPVKIGEKKFMSFSVKFERSESSIYSLNFSSTSREPGFFWHNIARPDKNWWEFLVKKKQLPACFENDPEDQGARIMSRYVAGDIVIAYAAGYGAVGWGRIDNPRSYKIINPKSSDDFLEGDCRHRISISWQAVAKDLSDGISAERVRSEYGIYHPISTSVSIAPEAANRLTAFMSEKFQD